MSAFALKILALVTMLIDHVGAVFFPQHIFLRYIGRLSFPIFAFLLAEGFVHTKSRMKYFLRLVLFGVISELPYNYLFYGSILHPESQNIMFELAMGIPVLYCAEKIKEKKYLFIFPCVLLILMAEFLGLSYGVYGIILMLTAYVARGKGAGLQGLYSAGTTIIFNGTVDLSIPFIGGRLSILDFNSIQSLAALAAIPIMAYNGKRGKLSLKWFFYIIYPAHLILLILVKCIIKI